MLPNVRGYYPAVYELYLQQDAIRQEVTRGIQGQGKATASPKAVA